MTNQLAQTALTVAFNTVAVSALLFFAAQFLTGIPAFMAHTKPTPAVEEPTPQEVADVWDFWTDGEESGMAPIEAPDDAEDFETQRAEGMTKKQLIATIATLDPEFKASMRSSKAKLVSDYLALVDLMG